MRSLLLRVLLQDQHQCISSVQNASSTDDAEGTEQHVVNSGGGAALFEAKLAMALKSSKVEKKLCHASCQTDPVQIFPNDARVILLGKDLPSLFVKETDLQGTTHDHNYHSSDQSNQPNPTLIQDACITTAFSQGIKSKPPTFGQEIRSEPPTFGQEIRSEPPTFGLDIKSEPPTFGLEIKSEPPTFGQEIRSEPPTFGLDIKSEPPTFGLEINSEPLTFGLEIKSEPPSFGLEINSEPLTSGQEIKSEPLTHTIASLILQSSTASPLVETASEHNNQFG
ncbi:B-cell CLL/lymphoma 7 protein family member B-like isoform X2 [Gouania willdenowi]|uniref:B-cell CLL/lymphoma 7 protein family member B-like isoform X2 n=1 Tax=Gouania willdenowi TaxID=441366 RepID=UPI001055773D|nr:B-cell CLL/lymphoma 7 protein family member B-like isoform X2 [Gouania willdenowi]